MLKRNWCANHRLLVDNAKKQAAAADDPTAKDELTALLKTMDSPELAKLLEGLRAAGAGPPGKGAKVRTQFDFSRFFQERRTSKVVDDKHTAEFNHHIQFKRYAVAELNWLEDKADK